MVDCEMIKTSITNPKKVTRLVGILLKNNECFTPSKSVKGTTMNQVESKRIFDIN